MIAIDTMVLIYAGLVPNNSSTQSDEIKELTVRAKLLFHMYGDKKIILPSIAISEILVPVPAAQRPVLLSKLSKLFISPSFDLPAAAIAADLWQRHKNLPSNQQYKKQRQLLRADAMIIASAKAAGATKFFSHDRRCRNLANLIMTGEDLPKNDPNDMFLKNDIESGEYDPLAT